MRIGRTVKFLFHSITLGMAAALVVLFFKPDLLSRERPKVEIHTQTAQSGAVTEAAPHSYAPAVRLAAPSVVNIFTAKVTKQRAIVPDDPLLERFFEELHPQLPQSRVEASLGSGVIFTPQGHVVTNSHVIAGATEIRVLLSDGRSAQAELVGDDPETDLAILKIDLSPLPSITLGNSDQIQVGDVVLAIGNPYGVGQTVTSGIVSATGRKRLGLYTFENFIQTDAAINPGNSGGALVNVRGELIGINSVIFSRSGGSQGIGFAIPTSIARQVLTQVIEHGHVIRGWLGIRMSDLDEELADAFGLDEPSGVVITAIFKDSPAHAAGLEVGDVIVALNGRPIQDVRSLLDLVAKQKPGTQVQIAGVRQRKPFTLHATVSQRPQLSQQEPE